MEADSTVRILIVEDMPSDMELAERELREGGIRFTSVRAETREEFLKALNEFRPELIISDYSLPEFDGMQALKLARERNANIPFIIFTGSINEETAVACLKAGATDYVVKDRLARLPFAVKEALEQKKTLLAKEKAEQELCESEDKYRTLVENINVGIYRRIMGPGGRFLQANPAMALMFGYGSVDELKNSSSFEACDKAEGAEEFMKKIRANGYVKGEERRFMRKDGTHIWCSVSARIHRDEKSGVEYLDGVMEDVTERKNLEAQLLQAQKMEAVGQLAGGIAHDFNNILTAMIGYGHILKMKMKENDPLKTYPDHILSLSDRAASLTQSLLAFSRKQVMNPRPVNLNEVIRTVEKLLFRIIGEDIRMQTRLSEKDLIIMADHVQIEQVLMNLATNARDAMPEGGTLTVETETVDIDHEFIKEHGFGHEGKYALVSVTDTGMGMERETREKIFEPFFTTKEVGKGTGLGLSMVYGIIRQHDGHINVYSEPRQGTTFRLYLPLIEANIAAEGIKPEVIQPIQTGTETILLAEDESEVREFTKRLLEEYGYKLIEATDGEDAIKKFRLFKDKIQLLLLDVIMPGKNGGEAYKEIKKMKQNVKALFLSGYPGDTIHKQGILDEGFNLIMKPVSPTTLLKKVREVLDQS
jgi:PAS domain S-box-containing protein